MTRLAVLLDPDRALRTMCEPITAFDGALGVLAVDMLQSLYAAQGRGLAAPQVGVTRRLFVMDTTWKEGTPAPQVFVNPEIIGAAEELVPHEERCLSIPDTPRRVARPGWVDLRWQDLSGDWHEARFEGFDAVCVQHERDHLDGILITDKPDPGPGT